MPERHEPPKEQSPNHEQHAGKPSQKTDDGNVIGACRVLLAGQRAKTGIDQANADKEYQ